MPCEYGFSFGASHYDCGKNAMVNVGVERGRGGGVHNRYRFIPSPVTAIGMASEDQSR